MKKIFWARFGYNGHIGLVPLNGDPELPCGGVTSYVIYDLYEDWLPELI